MGRTPSRVSSLLMSCSLFLAMPVAASAATTDAQRALTATSYVIANQQPNGSIPGFSPIGTTADAILDLVAVGRGATPLADALGYLRREVRRADVDTIGLRAKVVMAVEAAGLNGAFFGGQNLLEQIGGTERASGRFDHATVFDQALAILAIRAAGAAPSVDALSWLANAQCPDGGWQYDRPHIATEGRHCRDRNDPSDSFSSDSNTTAYAIMALEGTPTSLAHDPFAFLDLLRDPAHHGWGYTWGFRTTDANSTALVIQAYAAAATPVPHGALSALRNLQYPCGAVAYSWTAAGARTGRDVGASVGAVLGFLRAPLPVSGTVAGTLPATTCP